MAVRPTSYERRAAPGGTAPLREVGPDAFGASVGRAVTGLGQAVERYDIVNSAAEKRVTRNEETAAGGKALADYQLAATKHVQDMRDNAGPGGKGHVEGLQDWIDGNRAAVLENITDPHVRQSLEGQLASFDDRLIGREYVWQQGARVGKLKTDEQGAQTAGLDLVATAPDLGAARDIVATQRDTAYARIDSYEGLSDDARAAMKRSWDQGSQLAVAQLAIRTDPKAAKALADGGAFNDLDPGQVEQIYRGIGVADRRNQAEAAAKARLDKADARDRVDFNLKQWRDGVPPTDDGLAETVGLINQYDLGDDKLYDVRKVTTEYDVGKEFQGALPVQISSELSEVEARIAKAGQKAKPADIWRRDALEDLLSARRGEIDSDPYQFAARNGIAVTPVDAADPGSIAARKRVQGQLSRAAGRPVPFFTHDEAATMAARAAGDATARSQVAATLAAIGGPQALRAADQIAPKDYALQQAVALPAMLRSQIFEGEEALKANSALAPRQDVRDAWSDHAAKALGSLPARYRNSVLAAATNMYAYHAARKGLDGFDEELFNRQVDLAIDPTGRGGVGEWNGYPLKLPRGVSQSDLEHYFARWKFPGGAYHRDGSAIGKAELLNRFHPVATPDAGKYWFVDDRGRYAVAKSGNRGVVDLGRHK